MRRVNRSDDKLVHNGTLLLEGRAHDRSGDTPTVRGVRNKRERTRGDDRDGDSRRGDERVRSFRREPGNRCVCQRCNGRS